MSLWGGGSVGSQPPPASSKSRAGGLKSAGKATPLLGTPSLLPAWRQQIPVLIDHPTSIPLRLLVWDLLGEDAWKGNK